MQGTIKEIWGVGSSIVTFILIDDDGETDIVRAEGRPTVQALEDAFGTVDGALGEKIDYEMTDFGTMASFSPVDFSE